MKRKWVWKLWWNRECIDWFDTYQEAKEMQAEYSMAYHDTVIIKRGYVSL